MKKKSLIIVVVIAVLLIILGVLCYIYIAPHKEETVSPGVGGQTSEQPTWEEELYVQFSEKFNELYPDDSSFDISKGESIVFPLELLEEKGMDVSPFNTDTIHCDPNASFVVIENSKEDKKIMRSFRLFCSHEMDPSMIEDLSTDQ